MIKLVIFDMDGVLVDACDWHRIALNEALKETCNFEISLEEHYKEFNGLPTKIKLKKLEERGIVRKEQFETIENIKQEKTIQIINNNADIRKEKVDLMNFLKQKDIKIACYTNSIRKTTELMLQKTGVFPFFDLIKTNQDVKFSKPNPEGYLSCIEHFKCQPKEVIIVEDSPKGLEAANKTGAKVLAVKNQEYVNVDLFKDYL